MFDYEKIKLEVIAYAGEFVDDFDIEAVMDELRDMDVESIDDADIDSILQRHDISE